MSSNIEDEMYYGNYEGAGFIDNMKDGVKSNAGIVIAIMVIMAVIIVVLLLAYLFSGEGMLGGATGSAKALLSNDQGWYEGFNNPLKNCQADTCNRASGKDLPTISKNAWQVYANQDRLMDSTAPAPSEGFSDSDLMARIQTGH